MTEARDSSGLPLAGPTADLAATPDDGAVRLHDELGEGFALEERQALRRVAGIRTDLEDVTEVEYRQLRLERVVLVGVWTEGHRRRRRELAGRAGGARRDRPAPRCSTG